MGDAAITNLSAEEAAQLLGVAARTKQIVEDEGFAAAWPTNQRRKPYTASGILRLKCVRCGAPAVHQWQVCADGNNYRPLCMDCDVALNRLVLQWVRDPLALEKVKRYARRKKR